MNTEVARQAGMQALCAILLADDSVQAADMSVEAEEMRKRTEMPFWTSNFLRYVAGTLR